MSKENCPDRDWGTVVGQYRHPKEGLNGKGGFQTLSARGDDVHLMNYQKRKVDYRAKKINSKKGGYWSTSQEYRMNEGRVKDLAKGASRSFNLNPLD